MDTQIHDTDWDDRDKYGCPVAPEAAARSLWNKMPLTGTGRVSLLGLVEFTPTAHTNTHAGLSLMKPTCTGMISPGSSLSPTLQALRLIFLSLLQPDSAHYRNTEGIQPSCSNSMWEKTACFCPVSLSRPYKQVSIVDICLRVYNG